MKSTVKLDCFANRSSFVENKKRLKEDGCKILTEMICLERDCPFYKTREEFEDKGGAKYDL